MPPAAHEDISLGGKLFRVTESPGRITFFDCEKKQGTGLIGSLDAGAVKKDLIKHFASFPFRVYTEDINYRALCGDGAYRNLASIEYHWGQK